MTNNHWVSFFLLAFISLFAQKNCISHDLDQIAMSDSPFYHQNAIDIEQFTKDFVANPKSSTRGSITLPIIVHVLFSDNLSNISDAQIRSQIDAINRDFRKQNTNISNIPNSFKDLAADIEINFELASKNPSGQNTSGIERKFNARTNWMASADLKKTISGGLDPWDVNKYVNIWICDIGSSVAGYSQLPGRNPATDGIVIDYRYFGTIGNVYYPYNQGRTLTHELGHYFNLIHIWGDRTCGDDGVADTPTQQTYNYGCPSYPKYSCAAQPNGDMFMNFMDYTDDNCMSMFTQGQKQRIQATLSPGGPRYSLVVNNPIITVTNTCNVPSDVKVTNYGTDNVELTWSNIPNNGYTLYSRVKNTNWKGNWTASNTIAINNLLPATTYEFKLSVRCPQNYDLFSNQIVEITTKPAIIINTSCTNSFEPNNSFNNATTILSKNPMKSMISVANDIDYYKFEINNTTGNNFKLVLSGLTYDYDLVLYDKNYNFVSISQNFDKKNEVIVSNNVSNGIYYAQVYPYANVFDAVNCYNLSLDINSLPMSYSENTSSNIDERKTKNQLFPLVSIYPNPTSSDYININTNYKETTEVKVLISNMYGQIMYEKDMNVESGNHNYIFDQKLADGAYFISFYTSKYKAETYKLFIAN